MTQLISISAYSNAYDIRSHFDSVLLISATKNIVYDHKNGTKSFALTKWSEL